MCADCRYGGFTPPTLSGFTPAESLPVALAMRSCACSWNCAVCLVCCVGFSTSRCHHVGCYRDWCTPWDWRSSRRIHFTDPCLALRIPESFINCWPKEWRRRAGPAAAADPFMHKPSSAGLHRSILRTLQASGALNIKKTSSSSSACHCAAQAFKSYLLAHPLSVPGLRRSSVSALRLALGLNA